MSFIPLTLKLRGHSSTSVVFARPHAGKASDELPAGRTLFVASVPLSATAAALQAAFEKHGAVSAVALGTLDGGQSSTCTAHVTFASPSGLKRALSGQKLLRAVLPEACRAGPDSREELQRSVDSFMRSFEADEQRRQQAEEEQHNRMDSDGCAATRLSPGCLQERFSSVWRRFVLVTRKRQGRSSASDGNATMSAASQAAQNALAEKRAIKKKKKGANLDFYQFQKHERKREQLARLREQFEADKTRIAKMRAERKFKPF